MARPGKLIREMRPNILWDVIKLAVVFAISMIATLGYRRL